MIFDRHTTAPCVVVEPPPPDARCLNSEFSLSHPDVCESALIIKPGFAALCVLDSVQFRVYEYKAGVETELSTGLTFSSSNSDAFVVGVNGGAGTALAAGDTTIVATYSGRTVSAHLEVLPGDDCCEDQRVLTSIVVDNSYSMSLNFGGGYSTRLLFAKAVANAYADALPAKDAAKVWTVNSALTELTADFSSSQTALIAAVEAIEQTQEKTDFLPVFVEAAQDLLNATADRRILLLIPDGEQTSTDSSKQEILDAAALFKSAGGIVIVVAPRASGSGFDLLERVATGGFFINAASDESADAFDALNYLKSLTCGGACLPVGDAYSNLPSLNYSNFQNWEVLEGHANLLGPGLLDLMPGNGLYVELNSVTPGTNAVLRTIDSFDLAVYETYSVSLSVAGNQREASEGQGLKIYLREAGAAESDPNIFEQAIYPEWDAEFFDFNFSFTAGADVTVKLYVEQLGDAAAPVGGNLIDNVVLENVTNLATMLSDAFTDENLTYIPPRCGRSAAQVGIDDPDGPGVYNAQYNGTQTICNGDSYTYAVSWVTLGGETAASQPFTTLVSVVDAACVVRVILPAPPDSATQAHIWRNVADGDSSNLYLLSTVNPHHETYFDLEDHATFLARYDIDLTPPDSNTTDIEAGDLGTGFADCCYYDEPSVPHSVAFPNDETYVTRDGALTGAVNNTTGTISFWAKTPGDFFLFQNTDFNSFIVKVGIDEVEIDCLIDSGATVLMELKSTGATVDDGLWHHVIASWDLTDTTKRHLYVDGVNRIDPVVYNTGTIKWDQSNWTIGPATGGGGNAPKVYEIWLDNSYLNLSVAANREKFRAAGGAPANLGLDGSSPTGSAPLIYFRNQVPDWEQNRGSGGGFTEHGTIQDGGTDVPAGAALDTNFTDNCPNCSETALGPQISDPYPLLDIESGFTPPVVYTAKDVEMCATCPNGFVNLADGVEHSLISNTLGAAIVTVIHLTGVAINPFFYQIGGDPLWFPTAWTFEGSNDGSAWTVLDTRASQLFFPGEVKKVLLFGNSTAYAWYRYNITAWSGTPTLPQPPVTASDIVFPSATSPVCAKATATSTASQQKANKDASDAALASATALLNCAQIFNAIISYTGYDCRYTPPGYEFPRFRITTRSATRRSLISQDDANQLAQAVAEAAVLAFQQANPCPVQPS